MCASANNININAYIYDSGHLEFIVASLFYWFIAIKTQFTPVTVMALNVKWSHANSFMSIHSLVIKASRKMSKDKRLRQLQHISCQSTSSFACRCEALYACTFCTRHLNGVKMHIICCYYSANQVNRKCLLPDSLHFR